MCGTIHSLKSTYTAYIFDIHSHRRFLVLDFAPGREYIFRPVLRGNEGGTYWRMAALYGSNLLY
jgi:hypothetical protein